MKTIMQLRNERSALCEQAKAVLERNRDPKTGLVSAEGVEQYNRITAQIQQYGDEITRCEQQMEIERQINGDTSPVEASLKPTENGVASKVYTNAFSDMLRGLGNIVEVRDALSVGVDSEGGYTVPDTFEKKLVKGLNDHSVIRRLATVIHTESGMHKIPILVGLPGVNWIDEAAPMPETTMQFDRVTLGAYKLGAILKATNEFLHDTAFDIEDYLADSFGISVGAKEEMAFINGTGVKRPTGLLHDTDGAGIGAVTENNVTFDDVIRLYYSLGAPYRKDAAFLCNEDLLMQLMMLKDGNGSYVWKPSLEEGKPDTLLGKPVYTSAAMPELAAGNKVMLFGDFSYYWVALRGKRTMRRLNELYAVEDLTGFQLTQRLDGRLVLKDAMKVMKVRA